MTFEIDIRITFRIILCTTLFLLTVRALPLAANDSLEIEVDPMDQSPSPSTTQASPPPSKPKEILNTKQTISDRDQQTTSNENSAAHLTPEDCQKCHPRIVALNARNGGAHRSVVSCTDCHVGHPPKKRGIIPHCSKCHTDKPHFKLANCLQCHFNPHTPLDIQLTRNITHQCTTCHTRQIEELQDNPSIHTTLDCTACHVKHGYLPKCFQCHAPHLDAMTQKDCLGCHNPHMPLVVSYGPETPSVFCGSCHTEVYQLLGKSRAKHRKVPCVDCHVSKHKTIPLCTQCHKQPHPKNMLEGFPSCGTCHGIAHQLKLNRVDLSIEQRKSL